jgi:hypothetical protein
MAKVSHTDRIDDVVAVPNGAAALALLEDAAKGRAARWASLPVLVVTGVNDSMLPVRLDVPIAFKPDAEAVLAAIRQQLATPAAAHRKGRIA